MESDTEEGKDTTTMAERQHQKVGRHEFHVQIST